MNLSGSQIIKQPELSLCSTCGHHCKSLASNAQRSCFPAVHQYASPPELIIHFEQKNTASWIESRWLALVLLRQENFHECLDFLVPIAWSHFASILLSVPPSPEFASNHDTSFFHMTIRLDISDFDPVKRCHCVIIIPFKISCDLFQKTHPPCSPDVLLYAPLLSSPIFSFIYRSGPWQEAKVCVFVCVLPLVCVCVVVCVIMRVFVMYCINFHHDIVFMRPTDSTNHNLPNTHTPVHEHTLSLTHTSQKKREQIALEWKQAYCWNIPIVLQLFIKNSQKHACKHTQLQIHIQSLP